MSPSKIAGFRYLGLATDILRLDARLVEAMVGDKINLYICRGQGVHFFPEQYRRKKR